VCEHCVCVCLVGLWWVWWGVVGAQVQQDTIDELLRVQDSLEFRETEMERTRAELRSTKAEVTAMQGKLSAEFRYALPPFPPPLPPFPSPLSTGLACRWCQGHAAWVHHCLQSVFPVPAHRAAWGAGARSQGSSFLVSLLCVTVEQTRGKKRKKKKKKKSTAFV